MNARSPRQSYDPSSADTCQLELGQAFHGRRRGSKPATDQAQLTEQAACADAEPSEVDHECPELVDAHDLLDALGAGSRGQTVADRLLDFIDRAAGARAAAALNPDFGRALARYHLDRSGHPDVCPCNPCRQARLMR